MRNFDMSRRVGIFANAAGQQPMDVYMYGFVKRANLHGQGNWNGYVTYFSHHINLHML